MTANVELPHNNDIDIHTTGNIIIAIGARILEQKLVFSLA
jgi:hypothetical protein